MHRKKLIIEARAKEADSTRRLLALLAVNEQIHSGVGVTEDVRRYSDVMVYLHGFPDVAVHPAKLDFASRLPFKLAEAWLAHRTPEQASAVAFLAFNFGGVVGSDQDFAFFDKTISNEVEDAVNVCQYVRSTLLTPDTGRIHIVGISTGAIVASLLRNKHVADTISVIAGLADLRSGIRYDFTDAQVRQFDNSSACWKEFYLPDGCDIPANAVVSLDGVNQATPEQLDALELPPRKIYLRLHRRYLDECLTHATDRGSLDIRSAVGDPIASAACPLLVIHGDGDQNVPVADGEQLFTAAAAPKQFLAIAKGNHLLTNSKHLKKALQAILAHCSGNSTVQGEAMASTR